jgi:hypothetical protein
MVCCMPLQFLDNLAGVAVERDDLEAALDFAHRAVHTAREEYVAKNPGVRELTHALRREANVLEGLGRLDEAMARDAKVVALTPGGSTQYPEALIRLASKHVAAGEDAEAEQILRYLSQIGADDEWTSTSKEIERTQKPRLMLAELLERRGTEEALAEARTLRDGVADLLAGHEARRAAALEETRTAAAEAVRQWREERNKAKGKKGDKGKGKSKGKGKRKERARAKGRRLLRRSRRDRRASQLPGRRRGQQPQGLSSRGRRRRGRGRRRRRRRRRRGRSALSACKTCSSRTMRLRGATREKRVRRLSC